MSLRTLLFQLLSFIEIDVLCTELFQLLVVFRFFPAVDLFQLCRIRCVPGLDLVNLGSVLFYGDLRQFFRVLGTNDDDTVRVTEDDVSRKDHLSAAGDRYVDLTRTVFVGALRCDRCCIDRHIDMSDGIGVTDRSVNDDTGNASARRQIEHHLTGE